MVILGIDHGDRRIGLAVSDALGLAAHGLPNVDAGPRAVDEIAAVVADRGVERIVVGLPINMDGSHGPQAHKVRGFIKRLGSRLPDVPIETVDERLTSAEAHRALSMQRAKMDRRRKTVDRMAAQIILTRYLKLRESRERDGQMP